VNTFYTLGSNRPTDFGIYIAYAVDEVDEMLAVYEEDLKDIC
jgi:hypothetical protein